MDVSDGADNTFACAQANVTASEKLEVSSDDDTDDCVTDKDAATPCIECPVCLQPCIHPVQLPCSHIFCFLCVKGVANRSKRCALCRQEIPLSYFHNPKLVRQEDLLHQAAFEDGYQWFYEGRNGWWQYDERTSTELEERYKREEKTFELLIAGFLYVIDLDSMLQYRRNDPTRRRRIKRDLENIPEKKGVAGLRVKTTAPLGRQGAYGVETTDSAGKGQPTPASNGQGDQNDTSQGLVVSPGSVPTPTNSPHNPQTHTGPRTSNRSLSSVMRNLNISHAGDGSLSPEPRRGPNGTPANSTGAVRPDGCHYRSNGQLSGPDGHPSRSDGQPSGPDEHSSRTNGQPSGPDGRPSRYDGQPSGPDGRPSRSNGQLSGPYGRPSRSNGHLSGPDGRPSRSDGQQSGPDGRPSRSNGQLSVPDGRLSRSNVSLSGPDGRPSRSDGQPSGPDGHPSGSDGQPSGPDGRPSRTNGQLSGTDGRPSRTDGLPDGQRPDGQSNGSDSQLSTPDGDISISDGQPSRLNGRNSRSDGQSSWPERQVGIPEGPDGHHNPRLDAHRSRIDGQLSSLSGQPQVARQTSPHLQQQRDRESPHVQAPPLTSVTDEDALPLPARLHHQSSPQESRPAQRSAPSPRRQSKPPGQANEGGGENPCGTALPPARRSQSSPRVRHLSPTSHEAGSSVSDSGVSQRHSDPSPREARPALRHTRGQRNR